MKIRPRLPYAVLALKRRGHAGEVVDIDTFWRSFSPGGWNHLLTNWRNYLARKGPKTFAEYRDAAIDALTINPRGSGFEKMNRSRGGVDRAHGFTLSNRQIPGARRLPVGAADPDRAGHRSALPRGVGVQRRRTPRSSAPAMWTGAEPSRRRGGSVPATGVPSPLRSTPTRSANSASTSQPATRGSSAATRASGSVVLTRSAPACSTIRLSRWATTSCISPASRMRSFARACSCLAPRWSAVEGSLGGDEGGVQEISEDRSRSAP